MNNYLTIVSRSDFSNLYKFGHYYLHNLIPFTGQLKEHATDKSLFDAVTAYLNTYEYSTEYLLLHICRPAFVGDTVEVFVKDICGIYALSQEAKDSLAVSLDQRIKIQVSQWEPYFEELNKKQAIRQAKAGEYNCFEIFQISEAERIAINKILPKDFIEELYTDLFNRQRPVGSKSIWNYLVRYERHSPYWNDKRGFFLDAIHAFENYRKQKEIDYEIADETAAGDIIASCGDSYTEVLQRLMCANLSDYEIPGCNYIVVAPLFLYLRTLFKDGGITSSKFYSLKGLFHTLHQTYGLDFALAIALLGISLGHDLTYSFYYEVKDLGIFKNPEEPKNALDVPELTNPLTGESISFKDAQLLISHLASKITELESQIVASPAESSGDDIPCDETPTEEVLAETSLTEPLIDESQSSSSDAEQQSEVSNTYFEPIPMRKLKKGNKSFCKTGSKYAHSQEEYESLLKENYRPADFFDGTKGETLTFS